MDKINGNNSLTLLLNRGYISPRMRRIAIYSAKHLNGYMYLPPHEISLEPTNRCNLNCLTCARRYWDKTQNPFGDMPLSLFEKVVPYLKYFNTVSLQGYGEPLLGENFFPILQRLKSMGKKVSLNTNVTLLTKKNIYKLIDHGLDNLVLSIDGTDTLKDVRGISVENVRDKVYFLQKAKKEKKSICPNLCIYAVMGLYNIRELPDMVRVAHSLEIQTIIVVHAVAYGEEMVQYSLFNDIPLCQTIFEEANQVASEYRINLILPKLKVSKIDRRFEVGIHGKNNITYCDFPFTYIYVNWNGDVRPCCLCTFNDKTSLKVGNIYDEPIEKIWNNSLMRGLRKAMWGKAPLPDICKACPFRGDSARTSLWRLSTNGGDPNV